MVVYKKDNNRILVPLMLRSENTKWTTPIPISQGILRAITYGNGKFVAVGDRVYPDESYIYSSTDGVTWTESLLRSGIYNWYAITYGNGKFVVVGNAGHISTSEDGVTWTKPLQVGSSPWRAITYGNGKFVAVGDKGYISTSEDGVTWTEPLQVGSSPWYAITYGNGKFVAVGDSGDGRISTDGEDWSIPVRIGAEVLNAITYGNGKFVAVGERYIYSSTNGTNWDSIYILNTPSGFYWRGVTYGNKFVAIGYSHIESKSYVSTSLNGDTWSPLTEISEWQCTDITYGGNKFITTSWDDDNARGGIITLPNYRSVPFTLAYGKDVTYGKNTGIASVPTIYAKNEESKTVYVPNVTFVGSVQTESLYHPEILTGFSKTNYCTVGSPNSSSVGSLPDWVCNLLIKHKQTGVLQRIYSQNKKYPSGIEISADNKLCLTMSTSTSSYNIVNAVKGTTTLIDNNWYNINFGFSSLEGYYVSLENWAKPNETTLWKSAILGNNLIVAVGTNGNIITSTDGKSWNNIIKLNNINWLSIAYGNGLYIAVGENNYLAKSTDGTNWTVNEIPENLDINYKSIAFGNNRFVIVGTNGYVKVSTNGDSWSRYKATSVNLNAICYGDSFMAVGDNGYVSTSSNGTSWSTQKICQYNLINVLYDAVTDISGTTISRYMAYGLDGKSMIKFLNSWSEGTYTEYFTSAITLTDGTLCLTNTKWLKFKPNNKEIQSSKTTEIAATSPWIIGYESNRNSGNTAFSGEIDLKGCYINVNGERWWTGTDGTITVDKNNYDTKTEKIRRYI